MIPLPLAPLAVALRKSSLADQGDALTVPEGHDEIHPLLASVGTVRAGKHFVYPRKDLVSERNEVILQCHHVLHVQIVLPWGQLQLLSGCFHGCIFPQIHPIIKPVFGNLSGVCFVSLDLSDGTAAALLDEQRIHHRDTDAMLMQSCRYRLMVTACGLHNHPRVFSQS